MLAARRALYSKGKYDPEVGIQAALDILRRAGARVSQPGAQRANESKQRLTKNTLKQLIQKTLNEQAYGLVPGSGEEGVSGLVDPLQSMERPEPEEEMSPAALRKQRALAWKLTQDEKGQGQPTRATANTKDTSGLRQAELEDYYSKLYNIGGGHPLQPGDVRRVPDQFIAKLEEIIREELEAVLTESDAIKEKAIESAWKTFCSNKSDTSYPRDNENVLLHYDTIPDDLERCKATARMTYLTLKKDQGDVS